MTATKLTVERLRHPVRIRLLKVKRITELSPAMRRITFTSPDLAGFVSASFDDHVKLLIPEELGAPVVLPTLGEKGLEFAPGQPALAMRDYTPRRYDPATNELDIDFVLHHAGPATNWATHAQIGQEVGIAGPRGSFVIPTTFDWHLLIGDATALPAIGRRLEELPATSQALVIVQTNQPDAQLDFAHQCQLDIHWVTESATVNSLETTLRQVKLPKGEGYAWAAGEYSSIRQVRKYLAEELKLDKSRIRAASYWKQSQANTHEHFD